MKGTTEQDLSEHQDLLLVELVSYVYCFYELHTDRKGVRTAERKHSKHIDWKARINRWSVSAE